MNPNDPQLTLDEPLERTLPGHSPATPETATDADSDAFADVARRLEDLTEMQAALLIEIQELKAQDRVLTDLQDQCQRYRESAHQRDIVQPLVHALIGLADRVRNDLQRLRQFITKAAPGSLNIVAAHYVEMRQADLAEIEAQLHTLGVEPFESASDRFDAARQTCRQRIAAPSADLHGCIADRLLPGYQRDNRVVRREQVQVYVTTTTTNGD